MDKKIKFIIWLVIVIILAVIAYFVWRPEETPVKEPEVKTEDKFKSVIPDGLKIENEKVDINGINVSYMADLVNKKEKTLNIDKVDIIFYDAKNNELTRITSVINNTLTPNNGVQISSQTTMAEGSKIAKTVYKFKEKK